MPYPSGDVPAGVNKSGGMALEVTACFVGMLGLMPLAILPLFVGSLVDDAGLSAEAAGMVASCNLLGNAVGALLVSLSLHLFRKRVFVFLGATLTILSELIAVVLEASFSGLLIQRLCSGIGGGVVTGVLVNWIALRENPDRGFAFLMCNQFFLGALLFYVLPSVVLQFGVDTFYWLFLASAIVSILGANAVSSSASENHRVEISQKNCLHRPSVIKALIAIALFEIGASGIWAFVERMALDWRLNPVDVGHSLSLGTLFGIPGSLLVVLIGTRWGRTKPILCGALGCIFGLGIYLLGLESVWVFLCGMVLFNAAWSFIVPYIQGVQADLDPQGRVAVLGMFVVLLSIATGPSVFGVLIGEQGYSMALVFSCVLFGACAMLIFAIARQQDRLRSNI